MAATGYTPISLYYSTSAGVSPTAGNLANGELAINITDGKLFYKDNGGVVQTLVNKNTTGTVTSVGLSFTGGIVSVGSSPITSSGTIALTIAGTSGGVPYFSSSSAWASSGALTQYGVVLGGGAGGAPTSTTAGTAGQVLTSNGAGSAPTFQTSSGITTGKSIAMAMIFGF